MENTWKKYVQRETEKCYIVAMLQCYITNPWVFLHIYTGFIFWHVILILQFQISELQSTSTCVWHSRHTDEGRAAAVEEGAVDDLQDEGEVLQLQERDGGADRKQQELQRRQGQRDDRGPQTSFRKEIFQILTMSTLNQNA